MENLGIYTLNSKRLPDISQIGGKGYSLVKLTSLGLEVPPGIICTVTFFSSWISELKQSKYWKALETSKDKAESLLNDIKSYSLTNLSLSQYQLKDIETELQRQDLLENNVILAVRSSSPEEDLEGASFAGGYETYLGVNKSNLAEFVLKAFVSCLDYRVFKYKLEKGFNPYDIKIAIVIMKQIASESSGVGFSLNPINNDFDEAVITSNFGLGETVVGGIVTPDEYVVSKISKGILSKRIGKKEKVIHLSTNLEERTEEKQTSSDQSKLSSLDDKMIFDIVDKICFIEECYKKPIDIEFAVEKGKLYLLQARPITTYFRLPEKLMTKPGERRQLYLDVTLVIQGFDKSLSVLGISVLKLIFKQVGTKSLNSENFLDIKNSALDTIGEKLFFNLSNIWTIIPKEKSINFFRNVSTATANIITEVSDDYVNLNKPYELDFYKIGLFWRLPVFKIIFCNWYLNTNRDNMIWALDDYDRKLKEFKNQYDRKQLTFEQTTERIIDDLGNKFRDYFPPIMYGALINGFIEVKRLFEPYTKGNNETMFLVNTLISCLTNVTTRMGIELFDISKLCDKAKYLNKPYEIFKADYENKALSKEFYSRFDLFIEKYGSRGEKELDIKSPRYFEKPLVIIEQIYNLIHTPSDKDPNVLFKQAENKRPEIFNKLNVIAKENNFENDFYYAYQRTITLLPFREDPKFVIIKAIGVIKKILLPYCDDFIKRNLISSTEDFWNLTFQDILEISKPNSKLTANDIKEIIKKNLIDSDIFNTWTRVPVIFDSRGRFFSQKKPELKEGELAGETVSWGVARGKAKVMHSVTEKEFLNGEILVTKATDPGWTPLIINSGGIVLEIGGMLQHGALVSREFNKPCVVGIENVMNLIKDDDMIEVDAVNGIVRILK